MVTRETKRGAEENLKRRSKITLVAAEEKEESGSSSIKSRKQALSQKERPDSKKGFEKRGLPNPEGVEEDPTRPPAVRFMAKNQEIRLLFARTAARGRRREDCPSKGGWWTGDKRDSRRA